MSKKQRIPTTPVASPLNTPFDKLSPEGLAPGQTPPPPEAAEHARLGRVVLRRETAHRCGKTVIVVHDFPPQISDVRIEALGSLLKKACGCGGTTKDRTIEIQGDQAARIRSVLEAEGFRVAGVR